MNIPGLQLLIGFVLALVVAGLAFRVRALSKSGAAAAAVLGTVFFGLGGLGWAALLLAFFITSSGLSRLFKRRKASLNEKFSKGSQRDAGQVLANGGIAGLFALLHVFFPTAAWPWLGCAGALAAANADTWATELGVLSRTPPRLVTSGEEVERGTSGGISLTGSLAALGGALLLGILAAVLWPLGVSWDVSQGPVPILTILLWVGLAGLAGSLVDSLLGATIQAIYTCPACQKETERHPLHTCGTPTVYKRGLRWMDNDWVNAICTLAGGLIALSAVFFLIGGRTPMTFSLSTQAFMNGQRIPAKYSCDGTNKSPDLAWSELPAGTRSLALIADDPDAPVGTFTHWVYYNLPASLETLQEGVPQGTQPRTGGTQGMNSYRHPGYDGPCPPKGQNHRYFFKLYALDIEPNLAANLNSGQLQQAIQGHVLGQAQVMGTYGR